MPTIVVRDVQQSRATGGACALSGWVLRVSAAPRRTPATGHTLTALLSQEAAAQGGQILQLGLEIGKDAGQR